jgi:hypothetical protein
MLTVSRAATISTEQKLAVVIECKSHDLSRF